MALPPDLIKKIEYARNIYHGRNGRIRDLWSLIVDSRGMPGTDLLEAPGQESVVGNDPLTDMSLAIHMLSSIPPRHRLLTSPDDKQTASMAGASERALLSMWRSLDDERLEGGMDTWVREMAFWMCLTGNYDVAARVEVVDNKSIFIADVHNPEYGYPIYGDRHLTYYAYVYPTTVAHVMDKAEFYEASLPSDFTEQNPTSPAQIADIWERTRDGVYNTIAVLSPTGHLLRPRLKIEDRETIPVLVGSVGGIPRFNARDGNQATSGSILWQNERIYHMMNRWRSHQMQLVRDASQAAILVAGSGLEITKENTRKADIRLQGDIIWTPNVQASARRIEPAPIPVDIRVVDSELESMRQRGSFPALLFGGLNIDLSGFAIQQLLNAAFHRLGPHKLALERLTARIDRIWLEGFRESGTEITISGKDRHQYFREDFTKDDVPESFDCMVDLRLSLPSDLLSRLSAGRTAIQQGPLLDRDTVLDEILQVDDPALVKRRIDTDTTENHPLIMQLKFMKGLLEYGQDLAAAGQTQLAAIVESMVTNMMAQAGQSAQGSSAAQPRAGGQPPGAMPAEAAGMTTDMAQSMVGGAAGASGGANIPPEMR